MHGESKSDIENCWNDGTLLKINRIEDKIEYTVSYWFGRVYLEDKVILKATTSLIFV